MKIVASFVAAAALLLPAAQAAERKAPSPVLGFDITTPGVTQLAWFDPLTLAKLQRPSVNLDGYLHWTWSFSPNRSTVAIATADVTGGHASGFKLRFVSLAEMRIADEIELPDALSAGVWVRPDRLIGLLGDRSLQLAVVDTARHALVRTVPLPGAPRQIERAPGGLALLLATPDAFAPAVLAVVDADGGLRTVTLDRISIGTQRTTASGYVTMEERSPGFAVDRAHRRAFVVGADLTVAVVNLDTLRVTYHGGKGRRLAKANAGSFRQALWLGHDLLAVSGDDRTPSSRHPAGLRLVDTRRWKTRIVDRWIDSIERAPGSPVFVASSASAAPWREDVYGLRGERLYRLDLGGRWLDVQGPYGYLCDNESVMRIFDATTGRTLSVPRNPRPACPYLLYGKAL